MNALNGRIAVCVSGQGSNLRALHAAQGRGSLGGAICLVLADKECPATAFAREVGIETAVVAPAGHADRAAWDRAIADALAAATPDLVVLAGFMRVVGPATLGRFPGRILNVHPALLPAFPGRDGIGDALAAGVRLTGVTVHVVDESLDGGPIVAQEAVPIIPDDDAESLAGRIHAVEHRLLARCVVLALAGALRIDGRVVRIDPEVAASLPMARRALLSVSDKTGLVEMGRGLADLGFELVSTGGTARALRDAGLAVTDVASVTGVPEMLDGRVKTLHPRIAAGVLADQRNAEHRAQLAAAGIEPFELIVVNLYRFADAAARPGVAEDELIEEIDIGGPTLVRAAAKNHASVGIVTDPASYSEVLDELRANGQLSVMRRRALALEAFRKTAGYDGTIAHELGRRLFPPAPGADVTTGSVAGAATGTATADTALAAPAATGTATADTAAAPGTGATGEGGIAGEGPLPPTLDLRLERVQALRYGENPHQAAALYLRPDVSPDAGPFARGAAPLQGKALSYNNMLDAAAAAALARDLRGSAVVIVKHGNPCGAAEAPDLLAAWEKARAGDPVSAYGGVVAVRGCVDGALAERLSSLFLEVVVAADYDGDARRTLAAKTNLRLLADPTLLELPVVTLELRSAGGGVLVTESDARPDDPGTWRAVTQRPPTPAELADLDLAWRVCRRVASNAIVLASGGAVVGVGAGQMSRVDSARLSVEKAGVERARGAVCASDAFYPFADGVEVCTAAGVTAFVQPGGSTRDAEVIAAADRAGAAMVFTGVRHFRH